MEKIDFFEAIYLAFYSKKLYRDIVAKWGGYTILYLFVITGLSWISATYEMQDYLSTEFNKYAYSTSIQIPVLKIKAGKIETPDNTPYLIKAPNSDTVIGILDTSGKYKDMKDTSAYILVTKNQVMIRNKEKQETRVYDVPESYDQIIYPRKVSHFLAVSLKWTWIPIFIFCVVFSFIFRLILSFIYGAIGTLFNYFYAQTKLTYGQITQIAMIALTPAIVVSTLFDFFKIYFEHQLLLYFLLTIMYVFYGIVANKQDKD